MKFKKPMFAVVLVLAMILSYGAGASASSNKKQITAELDYGVSVRLDGELKDLFDASGTRVYPIMYNGTTYLPIRALANLLGLEVNWDQATQTVLLGTKPAGGTDLIDTFKAYDLSSVGWSEATQVQSFEKKTQDIAGIKCENWIRINFWGASEEDTSVASFNIGGKYESLTFQCYADSDVTLFVRGDNDVVLFQKEIVGGQLNEPFTVDLVGTSQLSFQAYHHNGGKTNAYIFDAKLK